MAALAETFVTVSEDRFRGLRVLFVEDQYAIAIDMRDMLTRLGVTLIGPVATLEDGMDLLASDPPDIALLDINLRGESVFPLVDRLRQQAIPFAFTSGYASTVLPATYRSAPRLEKPVEPQALAEMLAFLAGSATVDEPARDP